MPSRALRQWLLERPISDEALRGIEAGFWREVRDDNSEAWFCGLAGYCVGSLANEYPVLEADVADHGLEELMSILADGLDALDRGDREGLIRIGNRVLLHTRSLRLLRE
jgi:hypothetical protein